jgi:hypothetical protein
LTLGTRECNLPPRKKEDPLMKPFLFLLALLFLPLAAPAQQAQLKVDSFYSPLLNRIVNSYILLPPGYDSTRERYPSIYMLRGVESEWITPSQDGSRGGRDLRTVVADLYSQGKIGKMIYVMPGLSMPAVDAELNEMVIELFPRMDSLYRAIPARWQRGVDGFSYGGLDVMNAVALQPRAFCSAGSYDGSFFAFDENRILLAPAAQLRSLQQTRFMHHSGGEAFSSTTNFYSVAQLVADVAAVGIVNEFSTIPLSPSAIHSWWWADEHMLVTLPLHWQTFQDTTHRIRLQLQSPAPATHLSGMVDVLWSLPSLPPSSLVLLECSGDRGRTWKTLFTGAASATSYSWNSTGVPDGVRYLLRLSAIADTAYGATQIASVFTIDNPGNGTPAVEILSPAPAAALSGLTNISWWAGDPEGDPLTYAIDFSSNAGTTWEPIVTGLTGVQQYLWDSRLAANSGSARIRVRCSDGLATAGDSASGLVISNARTTVAASSVLHLSGHGDGTVIPHIVNPAEVTAHEFQVTFQDSGGRANRFEVRDLTADSLLLSGIPIGGAGRESPAFRGLRLEVVQIWQTTFNSDSSRWLSGTSNLKPVVTLPTLSVGNGLITGYPYPADYLLTVYDHVVDTSSAALDAVPTPMKFTVRNLTEDRRAAVVYGDADGNSQISMLDELVILEPGVVPAPGITWDLFFQDVTNPVPPQPGDAFLMRIMKPFTSRDTIQFTPTVTGVAAGGASGLPDKLALYQNFPNPFNPSTSIEFDLPRGDRVRVLVFNVLGQAVATLMDGPAPAGRTRLRWDAASMASGVYFLRVDAGRLNATRRMILVR